jgi:hypothetical protein
LHMFRSPPEHGTLNKFVKKTWGPRKPENKHEILHYQPRKPENKHERQYYK